MKTPKFILLILGTIFLILGLRGEVNTSLTLVGMLFLLAIVAVEISQTE